MATAENILNDLKVATEDGDHDKVLYLLNNELNELLLSNRLALIRAISNAGIRIADDSNDEAILELIDYEIGDGNMNLIKKIVDCILAEKSEWLEISANPIALIVEFGAQIYKGIADSIAHSRIKKAERDIAREKVEGAKYGVKTAENELYGSIIGSSANKKLALAKIESQGTQQVTSSEKIVKIAWAVSGVVLLSVITRIIYLKNQ